MPLSVVWWKFQFHKGTIKTTEDVKQINDYIKISIP